MIGILLAVSKNGVIGRNGKLPWYISEDLRYFKRLTMNKSIVMGRRTFDAIGKPLQNRDNYVVTHDAAFSSNRVTVLTDVEEIRQIKGDVFIIGGAEIVKQSIRFADRLYLTQIDQEVEGDVFVHIDLSKWELVSNTPGEGTEEFTYAFSVYERKAR
jgi:dihydrofolate reductase